MPRVKQKTTTDMKAQEQEETSADAKDQKCFDQVIPAAA